MTAYDELMRMALQASGGNGARAASNTQKTSSAASGLSSAAQRKEQTAQRAQSNTAAIKQRAASVANGLSTNAQRKEQSAQRTQTDPIAINRQANRIINDLGTSSQRKEQMAQRTQAHTSRKSAPPTVEELTAQRDQIREEWLEIALSPEASDTKNITRMQDLAQQDRNLKKQIEGLKTRTNAQRDRLLDKINNITTYEGYATTVEQTDAITAEKKDILQQLHQEDEKLGNNARFYTEGERVPAIVSGSVMPYIADPMSTVGTAIDFGNHLQELSSEDDWRLNDSLYSGWVTDDLTRSNMLAAGLESAGVLEENKRTAQKLIETSDEWSENSKKKLVQAKEGLGPMGRFGVDAAEFAIQEGIGKVEDMTDLGKLLRFIQSAGKAARDARMEGASPGKQLAQGITQGAAEAATGKLIDHFVASFGSNITDKTAKDLIEKMMSSDAGQRILQELTGIGKNKLGDIASDKIITPIVKKIYSDPTLKETWENPPASYDEMSHEYEGTKRNIGISEQEADKPQSFQRQAWEGLNPKMQEKIKEAILRYANDNEDMGQSMIRLFNGDDAFVREFYDAYLQGEEMLDMWEAPTVNIQKLAAMLDDMQGIQ